MQSKKISVEIYNNVVHLLDGYQDLNMPVLDYIKANLDQVLSQDNDCAAVLEIFLTIVRHRQFLEDVVNYFYCLGKRKDKRDKNSLTVLIHILLCELINANKQEIILILQKERLEKVINLLKFFCKKDFVQNIYLAACQYFDDNYVFTKVVGNLEGNEEILQELLAVFEEEVMRRKKENKLPLTKPLSPRIHSSYRTVHAPPNSPQNTNLVAPKLVPRSTYLDPKISLVLESLKETHLKDSMHLLERANSYSKKFSQMSQSIVKHVCKEEVPRAKPPRNRKFIESNIPVKKNAATILREAARIIKEEEKDIQKVNELVCGAANFSKYEESLEQFRREEEQSKMEDIKRKHLLGLLSREEAILAKQQLLEANRAKREQFDQEKKEIEEALKIIKQKNEEKLKQIFENTHLLKQSIEEKKKTLISEKQKIVQEVADTNRQLYEDAIRKQREELEKRMEIIKEIKALSSIKDLHVDKFDPTETKNLGLLCEMSLAELQERLRIKKALVKEEIEKRQISLRKQRQKQKQFLSETVEFIESCKQQRKIINTIAEERCKPDNFSQESKDILELKKKLQNARAKRLLKCDKNTVNH